VWIDCQALVANGSLMVNWDVREGVFPDGLIDDMFAAFEQLLHSLADGGDSWDWQGLPPLPAAQAERRRAANATAAAGLPAQRLLHEPVVQQALRMLERPAVAGSWGSLTYDTVLRRAAGLAAELTDRGAGPSTPIAVIADRGPGQLVGVLGVLLAGAPYLPIDTNQPAVRRDRMLADAGVTTVVTQEHLRDGMSWSDVLGVVAIDESVGAGTDVDLASFCRAALARHTSDIAYVIYTSGSTGSPKGVQISHRGALNTIEDVNRRFGVGADDKILGLTNLGFDLSVYDMFGPLAVGGCLVVPDHDQRCLPGHWAALIAQHRVTLWNSVPAHLQMMADFLSTSPAADISSLRLALLSGDWIPVNLPERIRRFVPDLELISLGGATEGSIWSIFYPIGAVDEQWRSIPYGKPLANQHMYVLDQRWQECPDGVTGEIYIGGAGVAEGYLCDPVRTAERFVAHPRTAERLYRTGDLGRYLPDGNIEFLAGRTTRSRSGASDRARRDRGGTGRRIAGRQCGRDHRRRLADRSTAGGLRRARRSGRPGRHRGRRGSGQGGHHGRRAEHRGRRSHGVRRLPPPAGRHRVAVHAADVPARRPVPAPAGHPLAGTDPGTDQGTGTASSGGAALGRGAGRPRPADRGGHRPLSRGSPRRTGRRRGGLARGGRPGRPPGSGLGEGPRLLQGVHRQSAGGPPQRGRRRGAVAVPRGTRGHRRVAVQRDALQPLGNSILAEAVATIARTTAKPFRVLEVGAGVGGTSMDVIPALAEFDVEYVFTDLSQFFLNRAKETFGKFPWVRYATLDIDTDFRVQGFSPNSFDAVIMGDVFHATKHVGRTLEVLRELLAPGGWLLFAEMTRDHYQIMTSMELMLTDGRARTSLT
jgi:pyochelin synthetase